MGVELIKDRQGREHMVLSDEDFYNDDIMGDRFEDYEILQVIKKKGFINYGFIAKVRSKINSKIYAMKKINPDYVKKGEEANVKNEIENLKNIKNPNTTKYFKCFYQDNSLYIISEFMNNGDLGGFLDAYKSLEKPIDVNTIWNIFMQCISSIKYIHSQNIVHRNITLTNILMSENKIIKLGDFRLQFLANNPNIINKESPYFSPEMKNNIHYDRKTDIYAMGVVFHQLCYFALPNSGNNQNENYYPNEIKNIINLMLENENKRPDANRLYFMIMQEYIKNVAKISSIDSVFRCILSFVNFNQEMKQRYESFTNEGLTPISFNFINCLSAFNANKSFQDTAIFLNNFRNLLYKNSQVNNDMEIKPSLVLDFLLEKLNKETGNNHNGLSFGIQPSNFNRNKEKSFSEFLNYFNQNFNSIISRYFVGIIKTKRICQIPKCREGIYSFNLFPFIEFDLDRCSQDLNLANWFEEQNNHCLNLNEDHNVICNKCKCVRPHNEFKQFYSLPQNFIISINRGEGFKIESQIIYPMNLDLRGKIEKKDSVSNFNLIGIVKIEKKDSVLPSGSDAIIITDEQNKNTAIEQFISLKQYNLLGYCIYDEVNENTSFNIQEVEYNPNTKESIQKIVDNNDYIIDIREVSEFKETGVIEQAKLIPLTTFQTNYNQIPSDGDVYVFCKSGMRAVVGMTYAKRAGYINRLVIMEGGMNKAIQEGYPLVPYSG